MISGSTQTNGRDQDLERRIRVLGDQDPEDLERCDVGYACGEGLEWNRLARSASQAEVMVGLFPAGEGVSHEDDH